MLHKGDPSCDACSIQAISGLRAYQGRTSRLKSLELQRLRQDSYDGFFSLEPHLAAAGQFQGFSGPDLFRHASQSFQQMLKNMGWEYS
jgi:hypothetical protein